MFTNAQFMELEFEEKKEVMEWRAKFHAKKSKATAEVKRIKKNGYNSFHKYNYATESDVKDEIRGILLENKLSFSADLINRKEETVNTKQGTATKTDVVMMFTLTDTETGYFENYVHDGVTIDNSDKGIYKAYSNTIKYFLMDQFLIPTGDDAEKDAPEIAPQQNNNQQQNQNPNQQTNQQPNKTDNNEKPTWRLIMDSEDILAKVSGKEKTEVRQKLKDKFGEIGKYKDLDPTMATNILNVLESWIDYYVNPKG